MKYRKISLSLIAASLLLGSCKKELDQQPGDSIAEANAFQTLEHVQFGLNAGYARLGAYVNNIYISALLSDEAKLGADNAGQGALTYRFQYSSDATTGGDVTGAYVSYYSMIDQINRVLPHVYTVTAPEGTSTRRDIIQGQLLSLRAIAHFELLKLYSKNYDPNGLGIAIMLAADPLAKPARNTMGEVITQVEKDFADAKALMPAVTPASFRDTVMNRANIAGYQARVALYKGEYANAITYATEVISSNVKPLVSGAAFEGIWTDANENETLLRVRYLTSTALGALFTTTGGSIYIAPSDKLVAAYSNDDIRLSTYIGTTPGGNNYVNKYFGSSRGGRVVDLKAMRTSEMYLIRAEAYAKITTPNLTAGAADVNAVRAARITGYVDQTFATSAELITATLNEKFKELAFEGQRFFDLKRNNLPVQRSSSDASPDWQTLAAGNYRFVLPIPNVAINSNPNEEQNEGY